MQKSKLQDMQRIVLDTNVLVSALISRSYPAMIVEELVLEERVEICISDEVMEEYVEVLRRPKFDRFANFRVNADILLNHIEEIGTRFIPSQKVEVLTDIDDNKFLELAIEADANFVITGNTKHFTLDKFENTLILTPADYWENYGSKLV